GEPGGTPRPGALAAVQPAATIRHRRLATGMAGAGPGATARRGEEVARRVAVTKAAAGQPGGADRRMVRTEAAGPLWGTRRRGCVGARRRVSATPATSTAAAVSAAAVTLALM